MREIKFRAYLVHHKRMVSHAELTRIEWDSVPSLIFALEDKAGETYKLMQYTGLKDKNGVDLFEGDVLDDGGVIEFRDDLNWDSGGSVHSGFFSSKGYEYLEPGCLSYHYQISEHEVIGNVWEHPGLLQA